MDESSLWKSLEIGNLLVDRAIENFKRIVKLLILFASFFYCWIIFVFLILPRLAPGFYDLSFLFVPVSSLSALIFSLFLFGQGFQNYFLQEDVKSKKIFTYYGPFMYEENKTAAVTFFNKGNATVILRSLWLCVMKSANSWRAPLADLLGLPVFGIFETEPVSTGIRPLFPGEFSALDENDLKKALGTLFEHSPSESRFDDATVAIFAFDEEIDFPKFEPYITNLVAGCRLGKVSTLREYVRGERPLTRRMHGRYFPMEGKFTFYPERFYPGKIEYGIWCKLDSIEKILKQIEEELNPKKKDERNK